MKLKKIYQYMMYGASGAVILQMGGCDLGTINEALQTVLLGITAAGSFVIIRNI